METFMPHEACPIAPDYCLETLSTSVQYTEWIYELMRPHLGSEVLEVGAGIGNLTLRLMEDGRSVTAIDTDERMIAMHRTRLSNHDRLHTECVSLGELAKKSHYRGRFDSVVSSNVLEHMADDAETDAVRASFELLRPGGFSVHWVPAFPAIYGSLDRTFQHYRRYRRHRLRRLFQDAGFEVVSCGHWNIIGFFGWWFTGRVIGATALSPTGVATFDRYVVPVIRRLEPWIWRPFGQSILIVAQRRS
jgi:SAM-dependent methyltransferase